jgi:antitoxin (DNA-binding transcriptional repressor) of toxin-antitoxin stability system
MWLQQGDAMKRVGVREFRNHATQYLAGDEVLAIERHGLPIGFYIPVQTSKQESFAQALERLEQTVQRVLAETGMSEEELSRLYDLAEPLPDRPGRQRSGVPAETHASGR